MQRCKQVTATHWGRSWPCLWLLMGGNAALVLNSRPFLKTSLICSVSVTTHTPTHTKTSEKA